jgi:pimeloyl-ACP methyl ester carboxylesterase
MPQVQANGISIEHEVLGSEKGEPLLLIMGLGAQMTRWPDALCGQLVRHGFRVIRYDNRDVGLSTHLNDAGAPDMAAVVQARMTGAKPPVAYDLTDMAADAVGLLDALGIQRAHVAGASMGGMIGQLVAADYPDRVLSLTSIMSSTGNPALPPPSAEAMAVLNTPAPHPSDEEAFVAHGLRNARTIGSPGYPFDEAALRERLLSDARRAYDPAGFARQYAAAIANGDRREKLKRITAPTVVLHGADDPLVPVSGGRDTADNIPDAELRIVPGMGHDLPPGLFDRVVDAILTARDRARAAAKAA